MLSVPRFWGGHFAVAIWVFPMFAHVLFCPIQFDCRSCLDCWSDVIQKNPRAHKNKIGTPPPPPNPPPKKGEFYGHGFSCRKNAFFPGVHKIGAPISGPRIADTNFTDTGIFLSDLVPTRSGVRAGVWQNSFFLCQAPPSYGSGRYGFGVSRAQGFILRDRWSVGTRHAFFSTTALSI